ncbi:MAG: efflux RND transporter periplasmic adaptor subunit [Gammaproteobacteria bacterium]
MVLAVLVLGAIAGCSSKNSDGSDAAVAAPPPAEGGGAKISAQAAERAGIELSTVAPGRIRETLTLYGSIKPNAEQERDIRARYPGVISSVRKSAGDSVKKGDVLLTVEANESLQVYSVVSPLSGQVLERSANPGDAVDGSMVLMKVADLSSVWAEFAVFARDLAHVRRGMRVTYRGADADEIGESDIGYVAPAGHADSQSVVARAVVENGDGRWVPGQFISGDVVTTDVQVSLVVAPGAVQKIKGRPVVFVQTSEGFEARAVEIGRHDEAAVEITSGIEAGERVVAKNSFVVKAEVLKSEAEED